MTSSKHLFAFSALLIFMLVLSPGAYAQRGYGHRHGAYYSYHPNVSVGVGVHPSYSYHPVYRPRPYYHPYYRLPSPYVRYGPAFGLSINILPFGYSQFFMGDNPFYYYNGIYYRPRTGGGYTVTQPPLGAVVKHLPSGAKVAVIDGQKYYVLGGTFYQEKVGTNKKLSYEVVGTDGVLNTTNTNAADDYKETGQAPAFNGNINPSTPNDGLVINELPAGSTAVTISQQKYYLSPAGVYYEEMSDANNKTTYKAVGSSTAPETKINEAPGAIQ